MAAEEPPQYIVSDVSLDGENRAEMGVSVNGKRYHIDFKPMDLREPGQPCPSKFEAQYLALVKEVDDLFEDTDQNSRVQTSISPRNQVIKLKWTMHT
jgi:hypothetical protein